MRSRSCCGVLAIGLLVVVLLVVCLCAVAYSLTGPSPACRNPATGLAQAGDSARTLTSGGIERCYLLHVPPGYDPAQPIPLVISLHGFASRPEGQRDLSQWNEIADRATFAVAYPQGTHAPLRWNSFPESGAGGVDDVQFMRNMLADAAEIVAVDPSRIYVNGMSNGGAMTHRLACDLADRVAAFGNVAGPAIDPPDSCNPTRPVPIIAFFGTADPLVRYEGGRTAGIGWLQRIAQLTGGSMPTLNMMPAEKWIAGWAERNGCNLTPEPIPASGDVHGIRYTGCQDNAEVVFYTIEGGGHTWPGGNPIPVGKTSQNIDASETMWDFFQAHPLP
jgi:polyhydroxybutyrate depolymerase